jgi:hypothetical protein
MKSVTSYQEWDNTNRFDKPKFDNFSSLVQKAKYTVKENAIKGVYV